MYNDHVKGRVFGHNAPLAADASRPPLYVSYVGDAEHRLRVANARPWWSRQVGAAAWVHGDAPPVTTPVGVSLDDTVVHATADAAAAAMTAEAEWQNEGGE